MTTDEQWRVIHALENPEIGKKTAMELFDQHKQSSSAILVSELIDVLSKKDILNEDIFDYLISQLHKTHYLIKLSVLNYFFVDWLNFSKDQKEAVLQEVKKVIRERNFLIVKNQALMDLSYYDVNNRTFFLEKLISSMVKTSDYRSHVRIYKNYLVDKDCFTFIDGEILATMVKITEARKFGKAVTEVLSAVKGG